MRRQAALLVALALAVSGCQSTAYKFSGTDHDIRFGRRRSNEKLVRHVSKDIGISSRRD